MSEKILSKLIKKNYNNQLEEILGKKNFNEDVKNTLLSIFYKIENGYNDYKTVKRETFEKKDYIEKLMFIIDEDCEEIDFINKKDLEEEIVDKDTKKIVCYPIETKILYDLAKIQKESIQIRNLSEIIEEAMSFLLNIGNNISIVEPLRDFNGFSWNIIAKDIENINYNLIYQNMIFLGGNDLLDKWSNSKDEMIDYFEIFFSKIEKKYGQNQAEVIITYIIQIAIEIKALEDENFKEKIQEKLSELIEKNEELNNLENYINSQVVQKKKIEKNIKNIDKILHDKNLLEKEYKRRNEKLPLKRKIFSARILKKIIIEERNEQIILLNKCNENMKPDIFLEKKQKVQRELKYLKIIENISQKDMQKRIVELQNEIIKCMFFDLKQITNKAEAIDAVYKYRYYNYLPITVKKNISDIKSLESSMQKLTIALIDLLLNMKVINRISSDDEINYYLTKKIFLSKIIELKDINIKPINQGNIILTIFDEEIEDENIELRNVSTEQIILKFNKKNKLFN